MSRVSDLWMPVPRDWNDLGEANVQILEVFPAPNDRYRDATGNEFAYWHISDQSTRDYGMTFTIETRPTVYDINPRTIAEYDKTSETFQKYARPSWVIESDNPEIIELARSIVGNETNSYSQARLLQSWVVRNIRYQGNSKSNTTLTVLHTREAQCSGISNMLVGLLRAVGIPARQVSGWMTAYKGYFSSLSVGPNNGADSNTHVWSEFYLPGYGWIQTDATAGGRNFAGINEPRIIATRGDEVTLGKGYPYGLRYYFHLPETNKGQNVGELYSIEVERLP